MLRTFRKQARRLITFNQRLLRRGSALWWIRGVERKLLYLAVKPLDNLTYARENTISLQNISKIKLSSPDEHEKLFLNLKTSVYSATNVVISLICASRKCNNPNNRLSKLIQSLLDTTFDLSRIELIIRIDEDDDLFFYQKIKNAYGKKLSIRFLIGPRLGYQALHTLNSEMAATVASSSKIIFSVADDCIFLKDKWDEAFLHSIRKFHDEIFFINTFQDISLPYISEALFFEQLWKVGPPSLFWAVSSRIIRITADIASQHEGWTACGNKWICDNFFEALQYYICGLTGKRIAHTIAGVITARPDTVIPKHKEGGVFSNSPVAIKSYQEFCEEPTQNVIQEMAKAIARQMTASH